MAVLGIDIAKEKFDATRIDEHGQVNYGQFDNNQKGFKELRIWLNKHPNGSLHACMEATNVYWEDLAQFLSELGFKVSVVNPARIKGFAMSQLRRNKTDKLDSLVIAQFCLAMTPKEWVAPTLEQRQLRALVRHLQALTKTRTAQKNRYAACRDERVAESLLRMIEHLDEEMALLNKQIKEHISQHAQLSQAHGRRHDLGGRQIDYPNKVWYTVICKK